MDNRKKIIDNIINELNGRSGFDDWWCNIDEDTQEEIEQTLVNTLLIGFVIWRCNQNIQDIYGETIFTKGLIYEQVKTDEYPMMLIDNKVEESEVYNLKDYFTSI